METPRNGEPGRPSDADLVAQARAGGKPAFEALVRRYQGAAVARAYALLHDRGEAEDAAQEGFLRAYRSLGQLQHPQAFASWLLRTVANVARRASQKRSRRPGPLPAVVEGQRRGPHDEVLDAIAALPDGYQEVLHLHYAQGYSCAEIGTMLGLKIGSVTSRLTRARQMLRRLLSEDEDKA